jgi:dTDP-4-dehydrorhamnose reductase
MSAPVPTKVLLLGGAGLLGTALRASVPANVALTAPPRATLDASDADALDRALDAHTPDWVISCAAFTNVDRAEAEPEAAQAINVTAVDALARLAAARGVRVLLPSTDYVFDGLARRPMREDDPTAPLSVYARTKRDGELALLASGAHALIMRVSWLYGEGRLTFPGMMWNRALAGAPSRVVDDQYGTPTHTADLSTWMWGLIARDARGIFHATGRGETTWAEVARRVYVRAGFPDGVTGVCSADYGAAASRPLYTVLDCTLLEQTLGITRRHWEEAMDGFLDRREAERAAAQVATQGATQGAEGDA